MKFKLSKASKSRIVAQDKELALKFASKIKITAEIGSQLQTALSKTLEKSKISNSNKRHQRKVLRDFINYLSANFNNEKMADKIKDNEEIKLRRVILDRGHIESNKTKKPYNNSKKIAISFVPDDYEKIKDKDNIIRLNKEIDSFQLFLLEGYNTFSKVRKATCTLYTNNIKLILSWIHKKENVSLDNLCLTSLIKVNNINISVHDFANINEYYVAKGRVTEQAKKDTVFTINILSRFFTEYTYTTRSKEIYISSVVALSKFLYKDITDQVWAKNYDDIPLMQRLNTYAKSFPKDTHAIKSDLVSWDVIINVLMELKRRSDIDRGEYLRKSGVVSRKQRTKRGMASSYQRFILLALFTLIPPSRPRVIRELRLGKTFKHGLFIDNVFVPKDKLEDSAITAKYYIHLQPEDYKTGSVYGEWLAEFPNHKFPDETFFYDYLDKWIYGGFRDVLLERSKNKQDHRFLLLGSITGEPMNPINFSSIVFNIFEYTIKEKLAPHKLRTIFRTYLVNTGASQAELESAAFWMRHSSDIAAKTYTKQTLDEKLAPGIAIATKLNSELLLSST